MKKQIHGTWKGNAIALLMCAAFFASVAILAGADAIPEYDELTRMTGQLANVEHRIRRSASGADREWWEITLTDGSALQVDDVIGFDADNFISLVQPGDFLTVLVEADSEGWNQPYEIRCDGEIIHSYETSTAAMRENRKTASMLPLIALLCAVLIPPAATIRRRKTGGKK